jgi:uncharacterized membrane protein
VKLNRVSAYRATSQIRSGLWFVPVMCVAAGVLLSYLTLWIDGRSGYDLVPRSFTGGPDASLTILGAVATSMVSLAALVLTITMVVVQLAMGQFSPRIVQPILKDKPSQFAIGIFVGTFAFAMLAMRAVVIGTAGPGQVPGLTVVVAFVLVVVSIAVLVLYVHHIGRSLRVSALIELVGDDTRRLLDRQYPASGDEHPADPSLVQAASSGVLCHVEFDDIVKAAREADCTLHLIPAFGEFVASGAPLLRVEGRSTPRQLEDARDAITLGLERTLDQDVAYGLRLLVDIAERSLSDSPFLDPTTAVQAIDRLHDCLRHIARRDFHDGRYFDADGSLRLTVRVMNWDSYVHLAYDEIRQAGAGTPQVARRLRASLEDLLQYAPVDRHPVLHDQLRLLDLTIRDQVAEHDVAYALAPDRQGIGVAAGLPSAERTRRFAAPHSEPHVPS